MKTERRTLSRADRLLAVLEEGPQRWEEFRPSLLLGPTAGEESRAMYEVLCGLIEAGLVEARPEPADAGTFATPVYGLTERGREALEERRADAVAFAESDDLDFRCDWRAAAKPLPEVACRYRLVGLAVAAFLLAAILFGLVRSLLGPR